jgi:hypothetical protein
LHIFKHYTTKKVKDLMIWHDKKKSNKGGLKIDKNKIN